MWADSAQNLRPGLNAGRKDPTHPPRRPLGWAAGKVFRFWSTVGDVTLRYRGALPAVSERWIRFYENRIGSGWESPPWDQPKPVWVNSASFFLCRGWVGDGSPNNEVFWRRKKFSGRLQKKQWIVVERVSETGAPGLGMCVMVASQDGPLASRFSRAESGEDNIINVKAGLGNANTLEVSNTCTPFSDGDGEPSIVSFLEFLRWIMD